MIEFNFNEGALNQLLVNPKATKQEKNDLIYLQFEFEKKYGPTGYFLVPSSGSSKSVDDSVKLIALHQNAVLNSANRVNTFFKFSSELTWGLVLPPFHVAGLGVYARAFCSKASVFYSEWNPDTFSKWINQNQINLISLVPTQIFDLVQKEIMCPAIIHTVFVGASSLSADLKKKALDLDWPIIETYGMTETASMIAVKLAENLQVMPDVDVATENDKLKIKCDSLMTCSIKKIGSQVVLTTLDNDWLQTEDRVEIKSVDGISYMLLLGRDSDFVKINGEGVSLSQLRTVLEENEAFTLLALPNQRTGFEIAFVYESEVARDRAKLAALAFNGKVRPFEVARKMFAVERIPRTDLGKVKFKNLEELIKGNSYEKL
jgi:O-succinylbenzoic acid--CoA ligase